MLSVGTWPSEQTDSWNWCILLAHNVWNCCVVLHSLLLLSYLGAFLSVSGVVSAADYLGLWLLLNPLHKVQFSAVLWCGCFLRSIPVAGNGTSQITVLSSAFPGLVLMSVPVLVVLRLLSCLAPRPTPSQCLAGVTVVVPWDGKCFWNKCCSNHKTHLWLLYGELRYWQHVFSILLPMFCLLFWTWLIQERIISPSSQCC